MDGLTESLATSFQVTDVPNSTATDHPRFSQYKAKGRVDQEVRRKRILDLQKRKRFDYVNHIRKLADNDWKEGEDGKELEKAMGGGGDADDSMEIETVVLKPGKFYKDQLMLSEWLVDVPDDLEANWLMVLCPVGKRCLVVASGGYTTAYSKGGYKLERFPSLLPGGSRKGSNQRHSHTILDCVYSEVNKTFYVLDLLSWNNHPVMDCETDFRFFWLHSHMQENEHLSVISKINPYIFEALPNIACTMESMKNVMSTKTSIELDGLLFYHKNTHYTFGSTPLVTWLKPFMLPELLGVPVCSDYIEKRPADYTDMKTHMKDFNQKEEQMKKKIEEKELKRQLRQIQKKEPT